MAITDPNDARLLAALAERGKAPVHELAAWLGMDPRDVAYRLVTLSGSGLPLLVGVECDVQALRSALSGGAAGPSAAPSGPYGPPPGPQPGVSSGPPSGAQPVRGAPSGPYPTPGQMPRQPTTSGPHAVPPSGVHPAPQAGTHPPHGTPSGPYAMQGAPTAASPSTSGPHVSAPADPVISTWGPPQTASWARGDQPPAAPAAANTPRTGRIGDTLESQGLEGERLQLQLLEVQDPADYLFGAAGYRLDEGERAVVVHTEITNIGQTPFASLPDNYLELLTDDGVPIGKAAVSLTSRPPHRIGVQPGETLGGHTVYVLPETTMVRAVRWSPRPEPDDRTLTWSLAE
ncbi:AsnC family protein [Haloechinothrix salitolerans]|uniref:AsnC family protein n=1 Tax=Haloechinothrix salitolerans TaxID=926830 RepID=A0ABW2C452_9PSEU